MLGRPPRSNPARSVLIVGSEAVPFAKSGGLADVLGSLPPALSRLGWEVTLVIPKYRHVPESEVVERFPVTVGGYTVDVKFHEVALAERARAVLVDVPELYDRDGLYQINGVDYRDNARRFAVLARAALELAARDERPPSIVHGHDWHAGLVHVYLKTLYAGHAVLGNLPSVFTIHNLAYQGNFAPDWLPRLDLAWDLLSSDRLEFWGRISFIKGGINFARVITTVSPTYAEEIQTPEAGFGFEGTLRARRPDLVGILNGIDTALWNPARDPFLPAPFDAANLKGKAAAKLEVLRRYQLPTTDRSSKRPLVGMISRMVEQKGFGLLMELADELPSLGASFVFLGTGDARYERALRDLALAHPDRIGVRVGFDEELAHLIEGGADIFLMPSLWEPCGLNQMYSLRYGTVPLVRAVGGLADTVQDYAPGRAGATGFVFRGHTAGALLDTLKRALDVFPDKRVWRTLQTAGMAEDHSWDRSAREYVKIYERAMAPQ